MMGVEVDHDEDNLPVILRVLAVAQELVVADGVKAQAPVAVQGWILTADAVDTGDEVFEAVRSSDVPFLNFVLFRVQIFLAAGLTGAILAELEGGARDTIT